MIGPRALRADTDRSDPDPDRADQARILEALFNARYPALFALAYRFLRSRADAEEVVQDAFLAVWHRRESWSDVAELHRYLFAVTRNRSISRLRHAKVERVSHDMIQQGHAGDGGADPAADAGWDTEANELLEHAWQAIEALPERSRQAILLRLQRHLSNAEIAEVMGITVKGVERNLTRAFEALRAALGILRPDR